ncbi:MAG: hypothetical protein ACR2HD_08145 [Solirubrobacteraceae bacterium]|nr:MAG: hypothetical protein DLM63_02300 [Solirubrobacterales bacterium]
MPPLLATRAPVAQVLLAVIVPAVYGALCGLAIDSSKGLYTILQILAVVGGIGAGVLDHENAGEAAWRGLISGAVFGSFILIAHRLDNAVPKASLPNPQVVLAVVTALGGCVLAALGSALGARLRRRGVATS